MGYRRADLGITNVSSKISHVMSSCENESGTGTPVAGVLAETYSPTDRTTTSTPGMIMVLTLLSRHKRPTIQRPRTI